MGSKLNCNDKTAQIGLKGENLIFLISQPRAGSTLVQRILSVHHDIITTSEPWLMLQPLYFLRTDGYESEYNAYLAGIALKDFIDIIPDGEEKYIESVRSIYSNLYQNVIENSGSRYFLDKTPRYYFIIKELYRTFPRARYIILLRNPLAVLCSILKTWIKDQTFTLYNNKNDLIKAPFFLLDGIDLLGKDCLVIHYEHLLNNPQHEVQRICDYLSIDFISTMLDYGRQKLPHWNLGDQGDIYKKVRPEPGNAQKWLQFLSDPQAWRLGYDYLNLLGSKTLGRMGYSYKELSSELHSIRPKKFNSWKTLPLELLLRKPIMDKRIWMRCIMPVMISVRRRGLRETIIAAFNGVIENLSRPK